MSEVLNTPFTEIHMGLGAKMAPFAGYNMPISYTGINDEHATVRNAVGVFDVSHMGEFILKGPDALDLIQRVTSNDASAICPAVETVRIFPEALIVLLFATVASVPRVTVVTHFALPVMVPVPVRTPVAIVNTVLDPTET